jgi:hypothetical protein
LVALSSTGIVHSKDVPVAARVFRTGNQLLVRDLPAEATRLALLDAQGRFIRSWPASSASALEIPAGSQAEFLEIRGKSNLTLRVPPLR